MFGNWYLKSAFPPLTYRVDSIFGRNNRGESPMYHAGQAALGSHDQRASPSRLSGPKRTPISLLSWHIGSCRSLLGCGNHCALSCFDRTVRPQPGRQIHFIQPPCAKQKAAAARPSPRLLNFRERSLKLLTAPHKSGRTILIDYFTVTSLHKVRSRRRSLIGGQ